MNQTHLDHLEEAVWSGSIMTCNVIDSILTFCDDPQHTRFFATEKVDGSPALTIGRSDSGQFFVADKNDKIKYFNQSQIRSSNLPDFKKDILSRALGLDYLNILTDGSAYRADCLYSSDVGSAQSCQPNALRYVDDRFVGKMLIVCIHTNLTECQPLPVFGTSNDANDIFAFSNAIPRHYLPPHIEVPKHILTLLDACKTRLNDISFVVDDKQDECLKRIRTHMLKSTRSIHHCCYQDIWNIASALFSDGATDKNRKGRWIKWIGENGSLIQLLLIIEQLLIELKTLVMHKLTLYANDILMDSYSVLDGEIMSEGFVITDMSHGISYKLVDRERFSMTNFALHGDLQNYGSN